MSNSDEEQVLRKVIITAAVTGAVHTPTMSDYLTLKPKEIADDAVRAYEAGAAIVHIHARNPETGEPVSDLNIFRLILTDIKSRCNVVICITTGGAGTPKERIAVIPEFKPELASLNCGTMNSGASRPSVIRERIKEYKYEWEEQRARTAGKRIFLNSFKMIQDYALTDKENGTKPELEIWDLGQIRVAKILLDRGLVGSPPHLQFVMGSFSGMPTTIATLTFIVDEARRQIGDFTWSQAAVGRDQILLGAVSLAMGGHVRVGMEDSLYAGYGRMARSSADQVERIVKIAQQLSIQPATPDEARKMLGLKGIDKVNY